MSPYVPVIFEILRALKSVTFIGMKNADGIKSLLGEYRVHGFRTLGRVKQIATHPSTFARTLIRRQKNRYGAVAKRLIAAFTIDASGACAISIAESGLSTYSLSSARYLHVVWLETGVSEIYIAECQFFGAVRFGAPPFRRLSASLPKDLAPCGIS
jgi:hypothetical protein